MTLHRHHPLTRLLILGLALAPTNLLSGCATIVHGRTQTVRVTTDPPGRIVRYEGARVIDGESLTVRKQFKTPQFTLGPGEDAPTVEMGYSPSVWILGDAALALFFIIPGLIAGGVDAATGAWRYLDDPQVVTFPHATGRSAEPAADDAETAPEPEPPPEPTPAPTRKVAPDPKPTEAPSEPAALPDSEEGIVSWYERVGDDAMTASGTRFVPEALTAAHRTLPFGSVVRVTRLDTSRSIVVTINDRGPRSESRILDLTPAGAQLLGILDIGLAACRIDVLSVPQP
jgi:hypothetical protein